VVIGKLYSRNKAVKQLVISSFDFKSVGYCGKIKGRTGGLFWVTSSSLACRLALG
jgi:hypothetical protein